MVAFEVTAHLQKGATSKVKLCSKLSTFLSDIWTFQTVKFPDKNSTPNFVRLGQVGNKQKNQLIYTYFAERFIEIGVNFI